MKKVSLSVVAASLMTLAVVVIFAAALLSGGGCGDGGSASAKRLVGSWEFESGERLDINSYLVSRFEFFGDGDVSLSLLGFGYDPWGGPRDITKADRSTHTCKWALRDGNRLQIDCGIGGTLMPQITISEKGTLLTFVGSQNFKGASYRKAGSSRRAPNSGSDIGGNNERDQRAEEVDTAAIMAAAQPAQQQQGQGQQVNPNYRPEFIDSLLQNFHVAQCCNSSIAACVEQQPNCAIARRMSAFAEWMRGQWMYAQPQQINENTLAEWMQARYASLAGETVVAIESAGWPIVGEANAPILVTVFYSAFCPASKQSIRNILPAFTEGSLRGRARLLLKGLNNIPGDRALVAAHDIGRFADMMNVISRTGGNLNDRDIADIATAMRFDMNRFNAAFANETVTQRLEASSAESRGLGIQFIPTYFIAGRRYTSLNDPRWLVDAVEHAYETISGSRGRR